MIRKDDEVVLAAGSAANHATDGANARIGTAQIAQRLPARRTEVMSELVVLHVRAVDDGHTEVDVEQDRHRLQLAHDDVAENANEGEEAFAVRPPPRELSDRTLPLLAQPLEYGVDPDDRYPNRVQCDEEGHARAAEPPVHRHPLSRRDGERHGLRVAVEQIDVGRAASERAGRVNAIADVLHAARAVTGDDEARGLVVEAK